MLNMPAKAARSAARLIRSAAERTPPDVAGPRYSPSELLSRFDPSSTLTVKRSPKRRRFFMYEEHGRAKLKDDDVARTIAVSPGELADLLHRRSGGASGEHHYYWTAPVAAVAPHLAGDFDWLRRPRDGGGLPPPDPRGPSLWAGTSGSGTQCHYDVADNVVAQLHGTKRVRCYPPGVGARHLHVFPDAHPRARKSQVDFDRAGGRGGGGPDDGRAARFPHLAGLPRPSLDVVLRPGDALAIPAFWFHHVENGRVPRGGGADGPHLDDCEDAPSVSVNSFSLCEPMAIAQRIFQKASLRPTPLMGASGGADGVGMASSVLKVLGTALMRGLEVADDGKEEEFIRRHLLEARYLPLLGNASTDDNYAYDDDDERAARRSLTREQRRSANSCVERILPDFRRLLSEGEEEGDGDGIALLVALHLLELWAVELVGASAVARVWDEALS